MLAELTVVLNVLHSMNRQDSQNQIQNNKQKANSKY